MKTSLWRKTHLHQSYLGFWFKDKAHNWCQLLLGHSGCLDRFNAFFWKCVFLSKIFWRNVKTSTVVKFFSFLSIVLIYLEQQQYFHELVKTNFFLSFNVCYQHLLPSLLFPLVPVWTPWDGSDLDNRYCVTQFICQGTNLMLMTNAKFRTIARSF